MGMAEQATGAGQDRRRNTKLRGLFDTAYVMIEPFFDPAQGWGGHSLEHLAFRVLRENFSELSSEEVHHRCCRPSRLYRAQSRP